MTLRRILAGGLLVLALFGAGGAAAQVSMNTPSAVSGSQINLSWSMWEGYGVIIYRWTGGSGETQVYAGWGTSLSNTGLSSGTTYYYKGCPAYVDEVNNWYSYYPAYACSGTVSATTLSAPAAPYSLGSTAVSGTQINLSWADGSGNESGFRIERKTGAGGSYAEITTVGANVTSFANTGLSAGTTYYYRVYAYNGIGNSGYTNEASATTVAPPSAPASLNAVPASTTQIDLTWTDNSSNETGFRIERKTGTGGTYSQIATPAANATAYSDTAVTGGNVYYYRILATNSGGDSAWSNEATGDFSLPAAPSGLGATDMPNGQVNLAWTDNSANEAGFKLERKTGAGGTWAQIAAPGANAVGYSDSGLSPGTTYFYRVAANNIAGDSAWSNEASITASAPNVTNGTLTYTYDATGNLVQTNAGGVVTTLEYDKRGRKTKMIDPDMGEWTYRYNALGELVWQCDPNGRAAGSTGTPADCTDTTATRMSYDVLGRMTQRIERDLTSTWSFDGCTNGIGKLCSATADNGYARTHAYDSLGRPVSSSSTIDSTAYVVGTSYDSAGRPDTLSYPEGFAVQNVYNAHGHLAEVRNAATTSTVYWKATSVSASGAMLAEDFGNGLTTTRTHHASTDRLTAITTSGTGGTVQSNAWTWDAIGNLTARTQTVGGSTVVESFYYDSLNRLISSGGSSLATKVYDYDAIGNLVYRSDVGSYTYGTRPHAVASVSGAVNASFAYDANGNLASGNGRTLTWTSYNMPATIAGNGYSYAYTYNPKHERVRLVHSTLGTFIYLHPAGKGELLYEKNVVSASVTEHKFYVNGGSGLVGVQVKRVDTGPAGTTEEMRYLHRDHLGSVQAITNGAGAVLDALAYEPFGARRYVNGTDDGRFPSQAILPMTGDRGFTAHEHLDEVQLVHMNGRVYDPVLARFMTPDPFIQAPGNLQSYNRYSYGFNSPLSGIDPSGYGFLSKLFDKVGDVLDGALQNPIRTAAIIAVAYYAPQFLADGIGALTASTTGTSAFGTWVVTASNTAVFELSVLGTGITSGFAVGFVAGGSLESGIKGAVSGALLSGVDGYFGNTWSVQRVAAKAIAGGLSARIQRGRFEDGFLSTGANSGLRYLYTSFVGRDVTAARGINRAIEEGFPLDQTYPVDKSGRQFASDWNLNVIGFNEIHDGSFADVFRQGGFVSRGLNAIPGGNAVAGFDDYLNNVAPESLGESVWYKALTIPTAIGVTVPALFDRIPIYRPHDPFGRRR